MIYPTHFSTPELKALGELIGWDSSRRPCVRPSTLSNINISKTKQTDWNQILSVESWGCGKGCNRFWARSDQNSGCHGKRYNGENIVRSQAPPFLIGSSSFLQVTSTTIKSRTVSKFSMIRPRAAELPALSIWKNPHILIMGEILAPWNLFKPSSKLFYWPFKGGTSFVDLLCFFCLVFVMPLCASVHLWLVVICWEGADLLVPVCGV